MDSYEAARAEARRLEAQKRDEIEEEAERLAERLKEDLGLAPGTSVVFDTEPILPD